MTETAVPLPEPNGYIGASGHYCFHVQGDPVALPSRWTRAQLIAYAHQCVLAERERCIAAAEGERLPGESNLDDDIAYEQAISDVIAAIRNGD